MSGVIKVGQRNQPFRRMATVELADHLREAREIIAAAQVEASRIVDQAQDQARRIIEEAGEEARIKGFERGLAEGKESGHQEGLSLAKAEFDRSLANLAGMFQKAIHDIDQMKERVLLAAQRDVLEFAVEAASKLTCAIGETHRQAAQENLKRALALLTRKTELTVKCNPKDLQTLEQFVAETSRAASLAAHINIFEDAAIAPGGCIVQSGSSEVDASLETQVQEMAAALLGASSHG